MKIFHAFVLIIFFSCNSLLSNEIKIVYVDIDKILNQSIAGKKIQKQLEQFNKKNISKYKKTEAQLVEDEAKIIKQKNILPKEEFQKKIKELQKNIVNFQTDVNKNKDTLNKMRIEATAKILEVLNLLLSDYASKNSISIIMQKKNIVIGKQDLDITKQMIELVNKKITEVKLN